MQIVYAASECAPWARSGGLGEVVRALPRQIAAFGHKVSVFIPYYRQVREYAQAQSSEKNYAIRGITIPFLGYSRFASILDGGVHDGVQMYFVDCPELFDREYLYGTPSGEYTDNWERYALFCRAILEATKVLGAPDVYHVHDWHTALLPVYLRTLYYFDPILRNRGTVLTVHNAGYQGRWSAATVERLLFPWEIFTPERAEFYGQFNYLKAGLVYADRLTTVSPRYAEEIQTHEYGQQLDGVFRQRAADLRGILNGLDYSDWNPAHDGNIAAHYNPENVEGKAECRRDLLHAFGAGPQSDSTAVLGTVTRLTTQKGIDVLAQIAEPLSRENIVLVVLGTGEEYYENLMRSLAAKYPGKVYTRIGYDPMLAHKVEAGSDIFLMPSRYEPCGLGQLAALKYGAVPVVRATGGLDSTIDEWNPETHTGNGFKFQGLEAEDFLAAIRRALTIFEKDQDAWRAIVHNGMTADHSWTQPAQEYAEVYEQVVTSRS
jgi:starch synthase